MRFRPGLQPIVGHLYEQLAELGLLDRVDICGIETRAAAFAIIDARYRPGTHEDDRIALDFAFEGAQGDLADTCEHCGRPGEVILKVGLEARLADPDVELGERLLCHECYESWSHGHD